MCEQQNAGQMEDMQNISEKIDEYRKKDVYPFHMPGHKRRCPGAAFSGEDAGRRLSSAMEHDYTEIDGFDNLYRAGGIIAESERRAAELFGADRTYYLVNGSTVGIMAAVLAAAETATGQTINAEDHPVSDLVPDSVTKRRRPLILVGPDCHKSVFNALKLGKISGLTDGGIMIGGVPVGDMPAALTDLGTMQRVLDWDRLPDQIEKRLIEYNATAVVITSPTYEGIVSDVERIARIAHRYGAALIVDEAHGSHFGMHPYFPENSNRLGADAVIHSMHKTMTGLTQTALLHLNRAREDRTEDPFAKRSEDPAGEYRISPEKVMGYLEMLQTSSPSYLLMSSIDACVDLLAQHREELFAAYVDRLKRFRGQMGAMSRLALFETEHYDRGKLVLTASGSPAEFIYSQLRDRHGIQLEMAGDDYALAMTSFADTEEGFDRLLRACREIDSRLADGGPCDRGPSEDGTDDSRREPDGQGSGRNEMTAVRKTDCYRMR